MTTALYRRYRPETFAEVIGQDHVTGPLRQALRSGQVNHAYLFSGPRGCGKTSSARILARVLNCAGNTSATPTDTPCGQCPSCVELATGGPGSLDVVEIDAASHGGVDDARELRERATFAPARDRFKVFILDEAHMVSPQGFNALLKIVEEPPPHVKFIFATTEPDKVIGTIRSRTHHYPFRLVPPDVLLPYLEKVLATEKVPVGSGVLSLVVRAGGGSVRDSLSVLDQLVAGVGDEGLTYEPAVALLGYTPGALLDDLVESIAARDGSAAFRVIERVVDSGHEPRRFVEDLLGRFRDLIVIAAAGEQATAVLRDLPSDQLERLRSQAAHLGGSELSRSADLVAAGLTDMVGATSPRLQLELLAARLLLPAADDSSRGIGARLDRVERVLASPRPMAAPESNEPRVAQVLSPAPVEKASLSEPSPQSQEEIGRPVRQMPPARPAAPPEKIEAAPVPAVPASTSQPIRHVMDTEMLRRRWPEVLATIANLRKLTAALVNDNALPLSLDDTTLRLGFTLQGHVNAFRSSGHAEVVTRALRETLGVDVGVEGVLADSSALPVQVAGPSGKSVRPEGLPTPEQAEASWNTAERRSADPRPEKPGQNEDSVVLPTAVRSVPDEPSPADEPPPWDEAPESASSLRNAAVRNLRTVVVEEDEPSPSDPDIAGSGLVGAPLIAQLLGGQVIDEEIIDPT